MSAPSAYVAGVAVDAFAHDSAVSRIASSHSSARTVDSVDEPWNPSLNSR
jgi:hypothetical protein